MIQKDFYWQQNIGVAGYMYGRHLGQQPGMRAVKTSGSSTTVAANTAGELPFSRASVGDKITFVASETAYERKIATVTDGDTIVVSSAVSLTLCNSWWLDPFKWGQTSTDGWHNASDLVKTYVHIEFTTIGAPGGIGYVVQVAGRHPGVAPKTIEEDVVTVAGTKIIAIPDPVAKVRLGIQAVGGYANTESVTAYLIGAVKKD